ncbi:hypothetical protein J6590_003478 [Homalodisca vitripennis]|nr:hypothetical protein J6590_003478 [Homalodisca vitripennis]
MSVAVDVVYKYINVTVRVRMAGRTYQTPLRSPRTGAASVDVDVVYKYINVTVRVRMAGRPYQMPMRSRRSGAAGPCLWMKYSRGSSEEREVLGCASMPRYPGKPKSIEKVELETGVPKSSVQRIIKKNTGNCYKSHLVHNLLEDDPYR